VDEVIMRRLPSVTLMYHRTTEENALRIVREAGFRLDNPHKGVWLAEVPDYVLVRRLGRCLGGMSLRSTLLEITLDDAQFLDLFEMRPGSHAESVYGMREWFVPPSVLNPHVRGIRIIEEPKVPTPPYLTPGTLPIQR
jgi:hypothetical protein